jgi:hypothetical protein
METITTFEPPYDMYWSNNIDSFNQLNLGDLNNKLFCTFTKLEDIDNLVSNITSLYSVMYNKLFVLQVKNSDEYVVTYNIDQGNITSIPENTILVHRKKESNTLYTINALNELIKQLNNGVVDTKYKVEWNHYRNSILLTQHNDFKQLQTKIFKVIEL